MPTEIDPSERLSEGWDPASLPARTPNDPMPSSPRMPMLSLRAPTLCEQGPCAHYHKAVMRFDAATPMDGSEDVMHTQTLRSCYPTPGIAIELEDKPVFECSRWAPDFALAERLYRMRSEFHSSNAGADYVGELAAWEADQARVRAELAKYSETPHPELGVIAAMVAEMVDGDTLELRRKGHAVRLASLPFDPAPIPNLIGWGLDSTFFSFTDECIDKQAGPGIYQLRIVNARGAIVSTRFHTIPTSQTDKETPTP